MSSQKPQERHMEPPVITPLGTIIYHQTGWELPPVAPGYRTTDGWTLEPIDPICRHLELKPANIGACGYHRIARRCKLVDSFVGPKTCSICPRRESNAG